MASMYRVGNKPFRPRDSPIRKYLIHNCDLVAGFEGGLIGGAIEIVQSPDKSLLLTRRSPENASGRLR